MTTFNPADFVRVPELPHALFLTTEAVTTRREDATIVERAIDAYRQHRDRRLLAIDLVDQGFDRDDIEKIAADPDSFGMGYA